LDVLQPGDQTIWKPYADFGSAIAHAEYLRIGMIGTPALAAVAA
jgi:hypothetical protein